MKINHFDYKTTNKIINIVENIIPNIDTNFDYYHYPHEPNDPDLKYNTSKQYLDENKKNIEALKDTPIANQYLLSFPQTIIPNSLISLIQKIYPLNKIKISGHWYYPNEGYIGWHTNHDQPNTKRLYITYASEDKKSFFRYLENGEIITCYDNKGITIREFNIPRPPNFFWHCVGSKCNRYSFGFKII